MELKEVIALYTHSLIMAFAISENSTGTVRTKN